VKPSRRAKRRLFAIVLAGSIVGVIALTLIAITTPEPTPRVVTLPLADRTASDKLVRDAEAVRFLPIHGEGEGTIEGKPASAAAPPPKGLLPVGSRAPAFALLTPTGTKVALADLRGKATLIEFFATWCPHCAAEAPHLARLHASLPPAKYAFVSINADSENAASVFAYHVYFGLPFPALLDPGGRGGSFRSHGSAGTVTARYRVGIFPTFYVLDPSGKIVWRSQGEQPDELLRGVLVAASTGVPATFSTTGTSGSAPACYAACGNP